jgi:hypothetical protein
MGNFVFNVAKGAAGYYATLPAANDAIIVVLLQSSGLQADSVLQDYATLSAVLASNTEQTVMGRKTITTATSTVDNTNDRVDADTPDITWTAATGNAVGKLLFCYDADTTSGTDANIIPLTGHDFALTPDGSDVTATVNVFYRAS